MLHHFYDKNIMFEMKKTKTKNGETLAKHVT